jgi:hypothetical protein
MAFDGLYKQRHSPYSSFQSFLQANQDERLCLFKHALRHPVRSQRPSMAFDGLYKQRHSPYSSF